MSGADKTVALRTQRILSEPCSAPSWRNRHWFPVASVHELDPARPTPVQIDGLGLVVWRVPEKKGQAPASERSLDDGWRIFGDACPHRLAPLSEGRIEPETGCLQCAYHGWEFDGDGKCIAMPSADVETCQRACEFPTSRAMTYPVRLALGLLWTWLGDEPPRGSPEDLIRGTELESEVITKTYTRNLPYGYDTLLENLMDPAHIPFAHHGLQGTRKDAKPISMDVKTTRNSTNIVFEFEDRTMGKDRESKFVLLPPFLAFYRGLMDEKSQFRLTFVCVPVSPGHSRLVLLYTKTPTHGRRDIISRLPHWCVHLFSNRFLDSDLIFLHMQERALRTGSCSAPTWQSAYFMPAKCDQPILAWRRWLEREGCHCVQPDHKLPPTSSRDVLLNRYEQHTQFCRHCMGALETFERTQCFFLRWGLVAFVLDRMGAADCLRSRTHCRSAQIFQTCLVLFQACAIGFVAIARYIKPSFHFVDYKHYLK